MQWNTWNLFPEKSTCLSACVWKWEGLRQITLLKSKKSNLIQETICHQTRLWMEISFSGVWIWRSMHLSKCSRRCQGTDLHVASSPKFEAHSFLHLKPKDMPPYIIPYYSQNEIKLGVLLYEHSNLTYLLLDWRLQRGVRVFPRQQISVNDSTISYQITST